MDLENRISFIRCRGLPGEILLFALLLLAGCHSDELPRPAQSQQQLLDARAVADQRLAVLEENATNQLLARVKAENDALAAANSTTRPTVNMLIISGGGDWGAFAAGFLKGWQCVPGGPMAKPKFDVVTGVSTGALIAPFAFLGDEESTNTVLHTYRNPQKDWVKSRGLLALLNGGSSYADIPGLERELHATLDLPRLKRIVEAGDEGRLLLVNVTNIDDQEMHPWDIVAEARAAAQSGKPDRIYQVLFASSALPGVFPPREIDHVLYVDGGITGNILFGGPRARPENDTFVARWIQAYPDLPIPKLRYWVIFNNEIRWPPEVVPPSWSSVLARSMTASTRAATLNCMRLMVLQAQLAKLRHNADVEVHVVAVPDGWVAPKPGTFQKETMNALADLGEKMGADPNTWLSAIPDANVVASK